MGLEVPHEELPGPPPRRGLRARAPRGLRGLRRELRQDLPPLSAPAAGSAESLAEAPAGEPGLPLGEARRRLFVDGLGIVVSAIGFGLVYGLTARNAGLSLPEAIGLSLLTFAGAAQFAAVGLIASGVAWPAIVLLTAFLNARHLLYAAALFPWLRTVPRRIRALMAYLLTDEAFALALHHFQRYGRLDVGGYWISGLLIWIPWQLSTVGGWVGASLIPDPGRLGLDVIFPAAMASLGALLVRTRRDLAAVAIACAVAVSVGLAFDPAIGIVAGGLLGPLVVLLVPGGAADGGEPAAIDETGRDPAIGAAP